MDTPPKRRHILRWILLALLGVLLVVVIGFVVWASTPLGPAPEAVAALTSDEVVQVEQDDWLVFRPTAADPSAGFIFYPGGRVDARSYAPLAREIAANGYLAVIAPMPLNLAVFSPNAASDIIAAFPDISRWAIGGHSLGGAMAAKYAFDHPDGVQGLALWAAYPADNNDLSDRTLATTSIYGTADGVAPPATIEASRSLLPATTVWAPIVGGNHAQFGAYGPQPGDGTASISAAEQQAQTVAATLKLLESLDAEAAK